MRFRLPLVLAALGSAPLLHAQEASASWHAQSLGQAVLYTVLFSGLGIVLAILGYHLFDRFTPGSLHEEIFRNRNVAAALVGAAVIVGICVIIAAAMVG